MGKGLGAKSGCGFFIPKSKMASKMAAKKINFLIFPLKELRLRNMQISENKIGELFLKEHQLIELLRIEPRLLASLSTLPI